jgi:hypothetical protein
MEEFLDLSLTGKELLAINKCRIYLRVLTLSDITSGNGKYITNDAFIGRRRLRQSHHSYQWPNWEQPSYKEWKVWRKAIQSVFSPRWHRKLKQPLGSWLIPAAKNWEWYETMEGDKRLYQQTYGSSWLMYKKLGHSKRVKRYSKIGILTNNPLDNVTVRPTTIIYRSNCIESEGHRETNCLSSTGVEISTTPAWLHYKTTQSDSILSLIQDIKKGKARAVSDGSYYPNTEFKAYRQ